MPQRTMTGADAPWYSDSPMWNLARARRLAVAIPVLTALIGGGVGCGNDAPAAPLGGGAGAPGGGAAGTAGGAGTGGGSILGSGGVGGSGGGACRQTAESCAVSSECCDGVCNPTAVAEDWVGCHPKCSRSADCASGCCLPYQGQTSGFCTDAKWCVCGADGARCGTRLPKCCDTQFCVGSDPQASFFECRKRCTQNTECPTNCCVEIPGTGVHACLDAMYCPK